MPPLNGRRVKHRMAKRGFRFIKPLAEAVGIEYGTLRPAITSRKPNHPLTLADIYRLAEVLRESGEKTEQVVIEITGEGGDGVPDEPPPKKTRDQQSPKKRSDTERTKGPKRVTDAASAA